MARKKPSNHKKQSKIIHLATITLMSDRKKQILLPEAYIIPQATITEKMAIAEALYEYSKSTLAQVKLEAYQLQMNIHYNKALEKLQACFTPDFFKQMMQKTPQEEKSN